MSDAAPAQVSRSAAQICDEFFVPAHFQEWASRVAQAAAIRPGQRVLGGACGTGVLTREIALRAAPGGSLVGIDPNAGMLEVARRRGPAIEWRESTLEALPFDDGSFDIVLCQFGLMFFRNRCGALREMTRVLRQGGQLAVAAWDSIARCPGYAALADLLLELFGSDAAEAPRAPFALGERQTLLALFADAGLPDARATTLPGAARFPSLDAWLFTEVRGWVLADRLDDEQYARLLTSVREKLLPFVTPLGSVEFDAPAHVVQATRA